MGGGQFPVPRESLLVASDIRVINEWSINPHQERQQVETLAENPQPLLYVSSALAPLDKPPTT
jgi:hypothetical protein